MRSLTESFDFEDGLRRRPTAFIGDPTTRRRQPWAYPQPCTGRG